MLGLNLYMLANAGVPRQKYHKHDLSATPVYIDVIMGAMASQITSLTIVYSTGYSGADERKHQSSSGAGEFPAQRASNAENNYPTECYVSLMETVYKFL